jgi:hypothetical protein
MPKMKCKCGAILNFSDIPCALEYLFIADVEYDALSELIDHQALYMKMKSFFKCPNCERVWIFWDGLQECATEYIKL